MIWRVEIKTKRGIFNSFTEGIQKDILDLGLNSVSKVEAIQVYNLQGQLTESQVRTICDQLLIDPITQEYSFANRLPTAEGPGDAKVIEIAYHLGVMDPVEESTIKGIRDLGITQVEAVRTAKKYLLYGQISSKDLDVIINKVLANKLIQHVVDYSTPQESLILGVAKNKFSLVVVDLLQANDQQLLK